MQAPLYNNVGHVLRVFAGSSRDACCGQCQHAGQRTADDCPPPTPPHTHTSAPTHPCPSIPPAPPLPQCPLSTQLDAFFKRSLHKLALDVARAQRCDAATLAGIQQRCGVKSCMRTFDSWAGRGRNTFQEWKL
jgi:hypothetical protein